jgi:hypothetical protein
MKNRRLIAGSWFRGIERGSVTKVTSRGKIQNLVCCQLLNWKIDIIVRSRRARSHFHSFPITSRTDANLVFRLLTKEKTAKV